MIKHFLFLSNLTNDFLKSKQELCLQNQFFFIIECFLNGFITSNMIKTVRNVMLLYHIPALLWQLKLVKRDSKLKTTSRYRCRYCIMKIIRTSKFTKKISNKSNKNPVTLVIHESLLFSVQSKKAYILIYTHSSKRVYSWTSANPKVKTPHNL